MPDCVLFDDTACALAVCGVFPVVTWTSLSPPSPSPPRKTVIKGYSLKRTPDPGLWPPHAWPC